MQLVAWLSTLLLAAVAVSAAGDPTSVTELNIETTFKPDDCSVKSAKRDKVKIHYIGTLFENDKQFDSSYERGYALPMTLGAGQVIQGWDEGLLGMCVGEKRTLTIPAKMGYGAQGAGNVIPPNAALMFKTELVEMKKAGLTDEL